jgi:crotonobetainyl-CoA:carnitine CoA-transferase CaiB-like acyl-CoA transferase
MPAADGFFILAVGNDGQFVKFCQFAGAAALAADPRFVTNDARVRNRVELYRLLPDMTRRKRQAEWIDGLARLGVPCGPVNDIAQVFADPQVQARGMKIALPYPLAGTGTVDLIGNPIKLSATPVTYRRPPPTLGQHTEGVLHEFGLDDAEVAALKAEGAI